MNATSFNMAELNGQHNLSPIVRPIEDLYMDIGWAVATKTFKIQFGTSLIRVERREGIVSNSL